MPNCLPHCVVVVLLVSPLAISSFSTIPLFAGGRSSIPLALHCSIQLANGSWLLIIVGLGFLFILVELCGWNFVGRPSFWSSSVCLHLLPYLVEAVIGRGARFCYGFLEGELGIPKMLFSWFPFYPCFLNVFHAFLNAFFEALSCFLSCFLLFRFQFYFSGVVNVCRIVHVTSYSCLSRGFFVRVYISSLLKGY